jgi:hypothetical protein
MELIVDLGCSNKLLTGGLLIKSGLFRLLVFFRDIPPSVRRGDTWKSTSTIEVLLINRLGPALKVLGFVNTFCYWTFLVVERLSMESSSS